MFISRKRYNRDIGKVHAILRLMLRQRRAVWEHLGIMIEYGENEEEKNEKNDEKKENESDYTLMEFIEDMWYAFIHAESGYYGEYYKKYKQLKSLVIRDEVNNKKE